jgi:hypothetical protein
MSGHIFWTWLRISLYSGFRAAVTLQSLVINRALTCTKSGGAKRITKAFIACVVYYLQGLWFTIISLIRNSPLWGTKIKRLTNRKPSLNTTNNLSTTARRSKSFYCSCSLYRKLAHALALMSSSRVNGPWPRWLRRQSARSVNYDAQQRLKNGSINSAMCVAYPIVAPVAYNNRKTSSQQEKSIPQDCESLKLLLLKGCRYPTLYLDNSQAAFHK